MIHLAWLLKHRVQVILSPCLIACCSELSDYSYSNIRVSITTKRLLESILKSKVIHKYYAILLFFCFSFSCQTNEVSRETFSVGVVDFSPLGYIKHNDVKGFHAEIALAISKEIDANFELRLLPYQRIEKFLISGELDFAILHISHSEELFSVTLGELFKAKNLIISTRSNSFFTFDDLKGKTIGKIRGASYDQRLELDESIKIFETNSYQQAIHMLFKGRIDAFAGTESIIYHVAEELGYSREAFAQRAILMNYKGVHFVASRSRLIALKLISTEIKLAIEKLKKDNELTSIFNKYIDNRVNDFNQ